ncbi:MAG: NapC/NirT family cytochrome c [Acidobacteriota bacterium]
MPAAFTIGVVAVVGILALLVGARTSVTRSREGKILAFVCLLILPVVAVGVGFTTHMERATTTSFCLSCHVMADHGRSLYIDDPSYLPARHFQNNSVPRDHACYTCHTDYTMFGTVSAKLRGLRHLWVQYSGNIPAPKDIRLYTPYNNRECLHCHLGARKFEEASPHKKIPDLLTRVKANQLSCLSAGCHEFVHDVGSIQQATFWKEP